MAEYSPGMRLIIRDEEWMVRKAETNTIGGKALYCVGISPLVRDHESVFLSDLEKITPVDPTAIKFIADDSPFFRRSKLYIESQWRQQIPTDVELHIGHKAAMDEMTFQLEPTRQALEHTRQRILIADTVGLGKTLEAGILISELIARGKGKRILVVTVKSMMTQFQKELWNRFTIPLIRLDSQKIQKIRAQLPSNYNPFNYYDKTIISVDTLKSDIQYRTHLEHTNWDIIVIDEAHNVAKRGSHQAQRSRLAELLANHSDTLIMLSATPHDGRPESFASLMNMLDPTAIADPHEYTKEDIQGLFIRRFKKDVRDQMAGSFKERRVTVEKCQATVAEEKAFSVFTKMELEMDSSRSRGSGELFKTNLEKGLFSSPAACIKSVEERIKKLQKRDDSAAKNDIQELKQLKEALEQIETQDFSRYNRLLSLLKSPEYNWDPVRKDDRLVIFTERIETMNWLASRLRDDLHLNDHAIRTLSGGMSDVQQQALVEEFGKGESPIRILVASDVASEGINLHTFSHRLIHFDIPWSLMVFQQRNGRIDRYGQTEQPDIRYFLIQSNNDSIRGDTRIMEVLVEKEQQAYKNIGDPTLLMGCYSAEEEEKKTASAIENHENADVFSAGLTEESEGEFDLFSELFGSGIDETIPVQPKNDRTLYQDLDYLKLACTQFGQKAIDMSVATGMEIDLSGSHSPTPELKRRLKALLPEEAMPRNDLLRLSPDKIFCLDDMRKSLLLSLQENAWPMTQYLWKQHPIFSWINDKAGLLYDRGEAPLLSLPEKVDANEYYFIISAMIPNRKSAPVIDEWFALHWVNGAFIEQLSMEKLMMRTMLRENSLPNPNRITPEQIETAEALLPEVIAQARNILTKSVDEYRDRVDPRVINELDKLEALRKRHQGYQMSFNFAERRKDAELRKIDEKFNHYCDFVKDTLEIENNPYIRVIAAITGTQRKE